MLLDECSGELACLSRAVGIGPVVLWSGKGPSGRLHLKTGPRGPCGCKGLWKGSLLLGKDRVSSICQGLQDGTHLASIVI